MWLYKQSSDERRCTPWNDCRTTPLHIQRRGIVASRKLSLFGRILKMYHIIHMVNEFGLTYKTVREKIPKQRSRHPEKCLIYNARITIDKQNTITRKKCPKMKIKMLELIMSEVFILLYIASIIHHIPKSLRSKDMSMSIPQVCNIYHWSHSMLQTPTNLKTARDSESSASALRSKHTQNSIKIKKYFLLLCAFFLQLGFKDASNGKDAPDGIEVKVKRCCVCHSIQSSHLLTVWLRKFGDALMKVIDKEPSRRPEGTTSRSWWCSEWRLDQCHAWPELVTG